MAKEENAVSKQFRQLVGLPEKAGHVDEGDEPDILDSVSEPEGGYGGVPESDFAKKKAKAKDPGRLVGPGTARELGNQAKGEEKLNVKVATEAEGDSEPAEKPAAKKAEAKK